MNLTKRQQEVYDLIREGYTTGEISKKLGVSSATISEHKTKIQKKTGENLCHIKKQDKEKSIEEEQYFKQDFRQDQGTISSQSFYVKTVEDALEKAQIDLDQWEVERSVINSWEVGRKDKRVSKEWIDGNASGFEEDSGGFNVQQLWQVKVWIKRRVKHELKEALEALSNELRQEPVFCTDDYNKRFSIEDYLLEISLVDQHFAKQYYTGKGWEGQVYLYRDVCKNILGKTKGYGIERVVLPIGNDFFHINGFNKTTQKGTPQDLDGNLFTMFKDGCKSVILAIEELRKEIPTVHVKWVPGNHDFTTSYFLCEYLDALYSGCNDVVVDTGTNPRKYFHFGKCLIGWTHGNEEAQRDLPTIMMYENKDLVGEVDHFEWHLGHYHRKKETRYSAGDTHGNVSIRTLPSLSGTDYWHYKKGYVGAKKAAEAYLWHIEYGPTVQVTCTLEEVL